MMKEGPAVVLPMKVRIDGKRLGREEAAADRWRVTEAEIMQEIAAEEVQQEEALAELAGA
jgi:hypothetical protein